MNNKDSNKDYAKSGGGWQEGLRWQPEDGRGKSHYVFAIFLVVLVTVSQFFGGSCMFLSLLFVVCCHRSSKQKRRLQLQHQMNIDKKLSTTTCTNIDIFND